MRKLILIAFISFSINCFANKTDTVIVTFYEDIEAMSDLTKESECLSEIMKVLDEFNKNGLKVGTSDGKHKGIPVNETQLLMLLKCMNVAANSKGKLLIVFVNKENDKLLNINTSNLKFNNPLYQIVSTEQFSQLMIEGKVDFKLRKVDGEFKISSTDNKFMSDFYINNTQDYVYAMDLISEKYPVLFEELNLEINISWRKYDENDKTKKEKAEVKDISVTPDCSFLGRYTSKRSKSNIDVNNIISETEGLLEMPVDLNGNAVIIRYIVGTMSIININSGSAQIFAEGFRLLL